MARAYPSIDAKLTDGLVHTVGPPVALLALLADRLLAQFRDLKPHRGSRSRPGILALPGFEAGLPHESLLERSAAVEMGFHPSTVWLLSQVFKIYFAAQGVCRAHIPDYLWVTSDRPPALVVVRGRERLKPIQPAIDRLVDAMGDIGWDVLVYTGFNEERRETVRRLHAYSRQHSVPHPAEYSAFLNEHPRSLGQIYELADRRLTSAVFRLLWEQQLHCDLNVAFSDDTVIHPGPPVVAPWTEVFDVAR